MSTFGRVFRVTTFGESHCASVGCIIDGVPPGIGLTELDIQPQLTRRRPGQSRLTTPRDEQDIVRIHSGTEKGRTLGTPIMLNVANLNVKPEDYKEINAVPRPGHADLSYQLKYGLGASSGGGRASARETIGRVAAGAVAEKFLREQHGVEIVSFVTSVGEVELPTELQSKQWTRAEVDSLGTLRIVRGTMPGSKWNKSGKDADAADEEAFLKSYAMAHSVPAYTNVDATVFYNAQGEELKNCKVDAGNLSDELVAVRCPHAETACRIATLIRQVKSEEDSIGGTVGCVCTNVPPGLGEPVFDKMEAKLAQAMMSIPATKAFEMGMGFACTKLRGSQHNDPFELTERGIRPRTNNAGGTLGGITSGAPLVFRVAVKPVSTIGKAQPNTVDYNGEVQTLEAKGRHDPCVLPRTPPLIEAMAALVIADFVLLQRTRAAAGGDVHQHEVKRVKL